MRASSSSQCAASRPIDRPTWQPSTRPSSSCSGFKDPCDQVRECEQERGFGLPRSILRLDREIKYTPHSRDVVPFQAQYCSQAPSQLFPVRWEYRGIAIDPLGRCF